MSTQVKFRNGTTVEHSTFTGAPGEMTIDTTANTCVVHDGSTAGGFPIVKASAIEALETSIAGLQPDVPIQQGKADELKTRPHKNLIINGNLDVWQRETSQTAWGFGSADRWYFHQITNVSQSTDVPPGSVLSAKITPTTYPDVNMRHTIENGGELVGGKACVLSFWAKADSARNITTDISDQVGSVVGHALTTSWQKFSRTITPDTSTHTFIDFGNTDGTAVPYYITQVQFEIGDVATDFELRFLAEELKLCQRYYEKSYAKNTFPGNATELGAAFKYVTFGSGQASSKRIGGTVMFKATKRVTPSIRVWAPGTGTLGMMRQRASGNPTYPAGDVSIGYGSKTQSFRWYCGGLNQPQNQCNLSFQWDADAEI